MATATPLQEIATTGHGNNNKICGNSNKWTGRDNQTTGRNNTPAGKPGKSTGQTITFGRNGGMTIVSDDGSVINTGSVGGGITSMSDGNVVFNYVGSDSSSDSSSSSSSSSSSEPKSKKNSSRKASSSSVSKKRAREEEEVHYIEVPTESEMREHDKVAEEGEADCCVCSDRKSVCAILPCVHKCMCCECARTFAADGTKQRGEIKCPLCSVVVEKIKVVFEK